MKHTKGKWESKNPKIDTTLKRTEIYTNSIDVVDVTEPIFTIHHNEEKMSESNANAQLISKAPEMYEALKHAGRMISCGRCESGLKIIESIVSKVRS